MGLLDVSKVTETLVRLLEHHVPASPVWPSATTLDVTPEPLDELSGDNTLGVYLYRIEEDAYYKNQPPMGTGDVPVRYTPMGLNLYYMITAHSDTPGDAGTYREQLITGCAIKALHDYPIIDDATQIGGVTIMPPSLVGAGNRFRVCLVPVRQEETADYFAAGGSNVRLAMHYMASVVLLEPEEPPLRPGRVLSFGAYAFTAGQPHLTGSRSLVAFTPPGSPATTVEARPAQAAPGETLTLLGSSLAGDNVALLLRGEGWADPIEADAPWNLTYAAGPREESVTATVQETIAGQDVIPGMFAASARVTTQRIITGSGTRDFVHTSNETPFVIAPRLDAVPAPDGAGVTQITGYRFQHPDLAPSDVLVYVADTRLVTGTAGSLAAGEFAIVDANMIEIRLPADLIPASEVPVRVLVRGAESAPQWVTVP